MTGDWEFGVPAGLGGANGNPDPTSGFTGTTVYGVDLNDDYRTDIVGGPYYLTTGVLDCSLYRGVKLRFARWLGTDWNEYVGQTVEVSNDGSTWVTVYANPSGTWLSDSSWQLVEYDISAVADYQSTVYVRWGYEIKSLTAVRYCGWNIDDVELWGNPYPSYTKP